MLWGVCLIPSKKKHQSCWVEVFIEVFSNHYRADKFLTNPRMSAASFADLLIIACQTFVHTRQLND